MRACQAGGQRTALARGMSLSVATLGAERGSGLSLDGGLGSDPAVDRHLLVQPGMAATFKARSMELAPTCCSLGNGHAFMFTFNLGTFSSNGGGARSEPADVDALSEPDELSSDAEPSPSPI